MSRQKEIGSEWCKARRHLYAIEMEMFVLGGIKVNKRFFKSEARLMNITLKIKLASIIVHLEEMFGPNGHNFDRMAIEGLLQDPEVKEFMESVDPVYLPVKRSAEKKS